MFNGWGSMQCLQEPPSFSAEHAPCRQSSRLLRWPLRSVAADTGNVMKVSLATDSTSAGGCLPQEGAGGVQAHARGGGHGGGAAPPAAGPVGRAAGRRVPGLILCMSRRECLLLVSSHGMLTANKPSDCRQALDRCTHPLSLNQAPHSMARQWNWAAIGAGGHCRIGRPQTALHWLSIARLAPASCSRRMCLTAPLLAEQCLHVCRSK